MKQKAWSMELRLYVWAIALVVLVLSAFAGLRAVSADDNFFLPGKLTVERVMINPVLAKQVGKAPAVPALDSIAEFSQHRGGVHRAL